MGHGDDVGSVLAEYAAYARELSGFVADVEFEGEVAAALDESAGDDAVEDGHVDVAAGDYADSLFAFDGQAKTHAPQEMPLSPITLA